MNDKYIVIIIAVISICVATFLSIWIVKHYERDITAFEHGYTQERVADYTSENSLLWIKPLAE